MKTWNKIPLFRLLIPLIIGIIFSIYCDCNQLVILKLGLVVFVILLIISFFKNYFTAYSRRWIFGTVVKVLIFVFGILITEQNKPSNFLSHFAEIQHCV